MDEQIEPSSSPARLVSSSTHFQKVILWAAATFFASQILLFFAVAIILVAAAACVPVHAHKAGLLFNIKILTELLLHTLGASIGCAEIVFVRVSSWVGCSAACALWVGCVQCVCVRWCDHQGRSKVCSDIP